MRLISPAVRADAEDMREEALIGRLRPNYASLATTLTASSSGSFAFECTPFCCSAQALARTRVYVSADRGRLLAGAPWLLSTGRALLWRLRCVLLRIGVG